MEAPAVDLFPDRPQTLLEDGDFVLCRGRDATDPTSSSRSVLVVMPRSEHPRPQAVRMLEHEHSLRDQLDPAWAIRSRALTTHDSRAALVLEDPGGEPLVNRAGTPMDVGEVLRVGAGLAAALRQLHGRGFIHKDLKPANVMTDGTTGQVWLRGFGIASRLPRERRLTEPPEVIAGTLAYMAPEQTGWMTRSIDARSDLYALGVVLYELLTGRLPFTASDPMAWVHAHIARRPVPPAEPLNDVPVVVSAIIMKLLAKTAEDRYQTAAGVERDLRRCLLQWEAERRIDAFPIAEHDTPDRLVIPEKLYGRTREIETLLGAFERLVTSGTPELVLVTGYSGIGKSSVVNELHKVLVPPCGLFASGKFDHYKRDIPYATLAQRARVDVNAVIRDMARLLQHEAAASSVAIRTALADDLPEVIADRVQLQQVFMNLMLNAIEAMKDTGGDLTITSEMREPRELLISVSDKGVGLPMDTLGTIFDAFVTTKPSGTGMGLAITGRLWNHMAAGCGPAATPAPVRRPFSQCRAKERSVATWKPRP